MFSTIFLFETVSQGCPALHLRSLLPHSGPWSPSSVPGKIMKLISLNDSVPSLLGPKSHPNNYVFLKVHSCGPGLHLEK